MGRKILQFLRWAGAIMAPVGVIINQALNGVGIWQFAQNTIWIWTAIGLGIFFACTVSLVYSQHRRLINLEQLRIQHNTSSKSEGELTQAQSAADYTQKHADWMTAALNRDVNNFPRCMFVHNMTINWHPLLETDSYFLIHYDIYSSSAFRLDIGKRVDGHLRYGSEPMEKTLEVLTPIEQLERSATQHLALRQWVSQSRMNRIALDGGNEINLIFSDINIWVEAKLPDGSEGPKGRLPIQDKLKIRIPTRDELERQ